MQGHFTYGFLRFQCEDRDRAFDSFMICILGLFYVIIRIQYTVQIVEKIQWENHDKKRKQLL